MNKLHYIISVPVIAVTLGFVSPEIDLHRNVREAHKIQLSQQKQGTEEHDSKRWSKKQKNNKKDKLESFRTRRSPRNKEFANRLRERFNERFNERFGDQRRVAQFYVSSWFVTSFSLDLDDNTLLRVKDIYAKAISEVGIATKGSNRRGREWREKRKVLGKIHSTFDRELKGTLNPQQYKKLKEMTSIDRQKIKVDRGET